MRVRIGLLVILMAVAFCGCQSEAERRDEALRHYEAELREFERLEKDLAEWTRKSPQYPKQTLTIPKGADLELVIQKTKEIEEFRGRPSNGEIIEQYAASFREAGETKNVKEIFSERLQHIKDELQKDIVRTQGNVNISFLKELADIKTKKTEFISQNFTEIGKEFLAKGEAIEKQRKRLEEARIRKDYFSH